MTEAVDPYIEGVIMRGDEGSALLAAKCAPTLRNSNHVDIVTEGINGIAVLRVPEGFSIVAHSASGDPNERNPEAHAMSLIDRLYADAQAVGATPLGMADVVDSSGSDKRLVASIADALAEGANKRKIAILNGELAILGERVNCEANISGTMIGLIPRTYRHPLRFTKRGIEYVVIEPNDKAVYINSDGVGTKTELYERRAELERYPAAILPAFFDGAAMLADDAAKLFAEIKALFEVMGRNSEARSVDTQETANALSRRFGFEYVIAHEMVGDRLCGWKHGTAAYNISGSAVSLIDDETLKHLPIPEAGDYIIAISGKPNPRSNGITAKRAAMVKQFGQDWHKTPEGQMFLNFLAEPSTVFYPVFRELLRNNAATSVYHMSGGAYKGKLAKPLAKHGLYAKLEGLYQPDWRELALAGFEMAPAEIAYAKWPMGTEGFVTIKQPDAALKTISKYGLRGKVVGQLELSPDKTGVELVGVAAGGKNVYFSGLAEAA